MEENSGARKFGEVACIVGLVCAIISFCCGAFYFFPLVGLVFSILGVCMGRNNRGLAIAGLIIVPIAVIAQLVMDIFTAGVGIFF